MKKLNLLLGCAAASLSLSAQVVEVSSVTPLLQGVENDMYYPVIDASGTRVLFTSANFTGLKMVDLEDNVTTRISTEPRAGLNAAFSCNRVVFETREKGTYGEKAIKKQSVELKNNRGVRAVASDVSARVEDSKLFITVNGKETVCEPVESYAGYLWPSVSPDRTKIMFFAAGKGIVITDLHGRVLSTLGNYESPSWLGDNVIVAMKATDDGHQFSSSQIVALSIDGGEVQPLTKPETMTMNPSASADGSKIVYNTIDGRLFLMNVKPIKK